MKKELTLDQWEYDLGKASKPGDGWTVAEISARLGVSQDTARDQLRRLIELGRWRFAGHRLMPRIDGTQGRSPVYVPVKKGHA